LKLFNLDIDKYLIFLDTKFQFSTDFLIEIKKIKVVILKNPRIFNQMIKLKLRRRKEPDVPYCPTCLHLLDSADNVSGWLSSKIYQCPKCGYRGSFYVTKDDENGTSSDETIND
jgi:predicted RNA-binding Zn-ribbon protein involved in translation (DUF1610 family)